MLSSTHPALGEVPNISYTIGLIAIAGTNNCSTLPKPATGSWANMGTISSQKITFCKNTVSTLTSKDVLPITNVTVAFNPSQSCDMYGKGWEKYATINVGTRSTFDYCLKREKLTENGQWFIMDMLFYGRTDVDCAYNISTSQKQGWQTVTHDPYLGFILCARFANYH